ncbi:TPA: hypothetical protein HLZ03_19105 [Escherichia coli]|jgi:hypothetical protein|uniref:Prophage protein n=1 Tax=Escherichia coli TaxID=562 RepID=A0AAW7VKA2_ECOLX|nr:hypothetical protein [Escherichia coli]EFP7805964.1 hypothetical protein [Shigella sonnei]MCZ8796623.1 hypothetical protein [Escherichia albertii]EFC2694268.1 hypothetical protein [Escherichia coli]EFF0547276.1 hypothetical protein [Escherichia coli]EFK2697266.1 hypothetical protein [Escherichia coli]
MNNAEKNEIQSTSVTTRKHLYDFYVAYNQWLKNGAPETEGELFVRYFGLCSNAYSYFESIGAYGEDAAEQLRTDFIANGLDELLPFNEDSAHYKEECRFERCHLNLGRVAWVEKHCMKEMGQNESHIPD